MAKDNELRAHHEGPHATMVKIAKLKTSIAYYQQYSKDCQEKIESLTAQLPPQYKALVQNLNVE